MFNHSTQPNTAKSHTSPHEALFCAVFTEIGEHRSFVLRAPQSALYCDTGVIHLVAI